MDSEIKITKMWYTVNWKLLKGELENCVTALIS